MSVFRGIQTGRCNFPKFGPRCCSSLIRSCQKGETCADHHQSLMSFVGQAQPHVLTSDQSLTHWYCIPLREEPMKETQKAKRQRWSTKDRLHKEMFQFLSFFFLLDKKKLQTWSRKERMPTGGRRERGQENSTSFCISSTLKSGMGRWVSRRGGRRRRRGKRRGGEKKEWLWMW